VYQERIPIQVQRGRKVSQGRKVYQERIPIQVQRGRKVSQEPKAQQALRVPQERKVVMVLQLIQVLQEHKVQ
jgi:hypothetical protein